MFYFNMFNVQLQRVQLEFSQIQSCIDMTLKKKSICHILSLHTNIMKRILNPHCYLEANFGK